MNQGKKKDSKKEEIMQPSIRSFIISTESTTINDNSTPDNTPRSRSTKRKTPPSRASIEKEKIIDHKDPLVDHNHQ